MSTKDINTNVVPFQKSVVPFQFENKEIRVITDTDSNPWFVANDVAKLLVYAYPANAVSDHCKKAISHRQMVAKMAINEIKGLDPDARLIPESDVYRLVMRSKLKTAVKFQDWVVEEVIPSIRKHGMYATPEFVESALNDPETMIKVLQALQEERARRKVAEETNTLLMHSDETFLTTDIAKELGFQSAIAFNKDLNRRRIVFKPQGSDHYVLYSEHVGKGWAINKDEVVNGKVIHSLRWTPRGRAALVFMYKERANLALM